MAGLEGDGGTGIFFRSLTLLLSWAILCGQEVSSSFIDVSFGRFPEVLCILGVPAARCFSSASTETGWNLQVIFFSFDIFVEFCFLPFAFSLLRKEVEVDKKKSLF